MLCRWRISHTLFFIFRKKVDESVKTSLPKQTFTNLHSFMSQASVIDSCVYQNFLSINRFISDTFVEDFSGDKMLTNRKRSLKKALKNWHLCYAMGSDTCAWFNSTCYHPPRETPGTCALGNARGRMVTGGIEPRIASALVYGGLVPRVGSRANQKIALCSWFIKRNGDAPLAGRREFFCRKAASLFWLDWNKTIFVN